MTTAPAGAPNADAPTQPVPDLRHRVEHPVVVTADDGQPELVGSRCTTCGTLAVPERFVCGTCASREVTRASAGSTGTLYSYATVHVSSSRATPYTLGYVDLDAEPRVLATISGDIDDLSPDARVELTIHDDGSWSFAARAEPETGLHR